MFFGASNLIFEKAKILRKNMTGAEKILWFYLKQNVLGFKFRRQHPLGIYIADFYCHKAKLVIEIDGSVHDPEEIKDYDKERQRSLEEDGLKVIRFKNDEIHNNIQAVVNTIENCLTAV
jgi:cyclase